MIYQKTFRTDCISKHTKINRGERTKYLVSNNHPAIVDRDLFNAVQAELARRSSKRRTSDKTLTSLGKYSGKYALSELLICAECGSPYKRKTWTKGDEKRIYWRCLSRIEHGTKYCPHSKGFEENKLHAAICRALKNAVNDNAEAITLIKANLAYAVTGDETNLDLGAIEKRIKEATKEMENYMISYRNTGGDKTRYLECIQNVADEIKTLREQQETAKAKLDKSDEVNSEIKRLCDWLDSHDTSFAEYDDMVIRRVVECMVAINSAPVKFCRECLQNSAVHVGAAIGFPLGQTTIAVKVFETEQAIAEGADEIDYVVNLVKLKSRDYAYVEEEMRQIVSICEKHNVISKVIFENCYLTDEGKRILCEIALKVKPTFIKTSTGFGTPQNGVPVGATVADVKLMKSIVGDEVKVKAAGGVRTLADAIAMIEAGAERIGTSVGVKIVEELKAKCV